MNPLKPAHLLPCCLLLLSLSAFAGSLSVLQYDNSTFRASPTNFFWANLTNSDGSVTITRLPLGRLSLAATGGSGIPVNGGGGTNNNFTNVTLTGTTTHTGGPNILSFATARATNGTMTINNLNSTIVSIFSAGNITNVVTLAHVAPVANGQLLILLNAMGYGVTIVGDNIFTQAANNIIPAGGGGIFAYSTNNSPVGWITVAEFPAP